MVARWKESEKDKGQSNDVTVVIDGGDPTWQS